MACSCLDCTDITIPTGATGAQGPTGATGAAGSNGTNGASIIHNDVTSSTTATNALEILKTFNMDAGQMSANGDMLHIKARLKIASKNTLAISPGTQVAIFLDGAQITNWGIFGNYTSVFLDAFVSRTSTTAGTVENKITNNISFLSGSPSFIFPALTSASVSAWANALDIEIKANDNAGSAIICDLFQVIYYKNS